MPINKKNEQGILEEVREAFINSSINEVGGFLANAAVSIIPVAKFIKPPLVAAFRTAGCSMRNKTKRKAESDSAEEIEFGEKEGPDGFQCVYDKNEIINKRPRVVDNFVPREKEEQNLDELFNIPKSYQFSLLGGQIGDIAELFNYGVGKRGNKITQSAL
ncbi:MAG: hypothetical protein O7157_03295, partial [Wolbachia endosymbiont of Tetragnatha montana]|nr:hypothetical protein [Wolbachia endosymbiont of Tetragnatha montana]